MKKSLTLLSVLLVTTALAVSAVAAKSKSKAAPAAPAAAPARAIAPEEQTSALFFSTCAESLGQQAEFDKRAQALANAKGAVKLTPENLKGQVSDKEAQDAWGLKGFADANKPLLLTYNKDENICSMHVSDIAPEAMRHAFQADLKKLAELHKATVKPYAPKTDGDIKVLGADLAYDGKTMALGIAINAKTGEEFLTFHI